MKYNLSVCCMLILLSSYTLFAQSQSRQKPTVEVVQLKETTVYDKTYYGARLEPKDTTVHATPFEGTIIQIFVTEGQTVKAGASLYSIVRTSQASTGDYVPLVVHATVGGMVMSIDVKKNEEVANKTPAVTIGDVSSLKATILVSDRDITSLKVGLKCTVLGSVVGTIQKIGILPDSKSGLFPVEIGFEKNAGLYPGLFVKIEIPINPQNGIFIPGTSVFSRYGKKYAYIVRDNRAEMQEIQILKMVGPDALVTGLTQGDMLAVTNIRMLSDGAEVTPVPSKTAGR